MRELLPEWSKYVQELLPVMVQICARVVGRVMVQICERVVARVMVQIYVRELLAE